ncbi:MAG: FGGY family carbohydrate kinase [Anaerobutyricum hallii]
MKKYVLGIDQSTQGTKGIIFDGSGKIIARTDLAHDQIINEKGWVEHNPDQIMKNVIQVVKNVVEKAGIDKEEILTLGISNQRETAVCWNKNTGRPVYNAIVWQCARGEAICNKIAEDGYAQMVQEHSGIPLSPYYSAAKIAWVLQNVPEAKEAADKGELAVGTMDSYLVYQLTKDHAFKTDYSNASRTQMFNVSALDWDEELISLFGIKKEMLAEICDSNALYGYTDFDGYLEEAIPIHGVMGDSHGALYGQGCVNSGMIKATYGTGSSIMMNVGEKPIFSDKGVVTSLAWSLSGKVNYVLEGNINYTGADASIEAVQKAYDAGIPTFMVDREINKEGLCVSQIVANNDQGAQAAAEALVEATGGKGDYAELLGLESDTNCQVRSNAFHRVLDQTDMKMVAQQSANWDQTEGQSKAETILQQYPDITAIVCGNDTMACGAAAAVAAANLDHDVYIIGVDGSNDMRDNIKDGKALATALQQIDKITRNAVTQANDYLTNGTTGLEEKQLVDCVVITKDNADKLDNFVFAE